MNTRLSLPPGDDLDTLMRKAARAFAMDIYKREQILESLNLAEHQFRMWERHPRFLGYLKQEQEAWRAAGNVAERAKLKAGIIMEEFMEQAYGELHDKKTPLNQRVELMKVVAKVAGLDNGAAGVRGGGGSGPGFALQINIGQGQERVTISARNIPTIDHANNELHYESDEPESY